MEFLEISEEEYTKFRDQYKEKNFWQSLEMAKMRKNSNPSWDYQCVALKDGDTIKASAVLVSLPVFMGKKLYMSLRGFLIDYDALDLVEAFLTELKIYLNEHDCLYFRTDPYIDYQDHDLNGYVVEGKKRDELIQLFEREGFVHSGFRNGHDPNFEPRWMSILDLEGKTNQDIFKAMHTNTRQSIRNAEKMGVKVKELKREELYILKELVDIAGEIRDFESLSISKYEAYYDNFQDHFKACLAYIDLDEYERNVLNDQARQEKILAKALEDLKKTPDSQKKINRKKEAEYAIEGCHRKLKEIKEYKEKYGTVLNLAAACFMLTDYETLYLYSGSNKDLNRFAGSFMIQWHMIQMAIDHHCSRYNFYGISGNFHESAEDYGVFTFKRSFNACVAELVGDFTYTAKPSEFRIYTMLRNVKHKLFR